MASSPQEPIYSHMVPERDLSRVIDDDDDGISFGRFAKQLHVYSFRSYLTGPGVCPFYCLSIVKVINVQVFSAPRFAAKGILPKQITSNESVWKNYDCRWVLMTTVS